MIETNFHKHLPEKAGLTQNDWHELNYSEIQKGGFPYLITKIKLT